MTQLLGPTLRKAMTHSALYQAWEKVADNNGMAGTDGVTIDSLAGNIHPLLKELAQSVVKGTYQPLPLKRV